MIDYTLVRDTVARVLTSSFSECTVEYENVPLSNKSPKEVVSFYDDNVISSRISFDSTMTDGIVTFQIFTELGTGTERNRVIGKELAQLFQNKTIDGVDFGPAIFVAAAPIESAMYFQRNLLIDYTVNFGETDDTGC